MPRTKNAPRTVQPSEVDMAAVLAEVKAMREENARLAAELAAAKEKGAGGYQKKPAGFHITPDSDLDKYTKAHAVRVLEDGSVIQWSIKPGKGGSMARPWIGCDINLRFGKPKPPHTKGLPIPGFGGTEETWCGYDGYLRGPDYKADRLWTRKRAKELAAEAAAKA